jgi:hypothetical protein
MTDLSKIIAKIKALRARAADAASSENEAAKAAEVADRLLREHNINLSELDVRADGVDKNVWNPGARVRTPECSAAAAIAKGLGLECWVRNGGEITFLGAPADVEVAFYFMDLASNASHAGLKAYRKTEDYRNDQRYSSARKVGTDFRRGVCARLGQRIRDNLDLEKTPQATGAGLVVVKNALIQQWLKDHGIGFKSHRGSRVGAGYGRGQEYAEGVSVGRGIGTQRSGQLALR